MYLCKGKTAGGKRCKRKTGQKDDYCSIHEEQRSRVPMEVDMEAVVPEIADFKDGDLTQRLCGHCCDLALEKCCECLEISVTDARGERDIHGYCKKCTERCQPGRIEAPRNFVRFEPTNPAFQVAFDRLLQDLGLL